MLSACTAVETGSGGTTPGVVPGHLRIALQQDVKTLNPLLTSNTSDAFVARLMFEPLVSANAAGALIPTLATEIPTLTNGGISRDGLTITYHMRANVRWTDGVAVTSKDVKWSWQAIMNRDNNIISRHGYDVVDSIDTPNPRTAIVHLKRPFAPFTATFFADSDQPFPIAPAHVLEQYPNINQLAFNSNPDVSDGPFKFVRWQHGDHIDLTANDHFFMGKPKLQSIALRVVPDESTTVNLMRTHEIDFWFQASIHNYPQVKNLPGVRPYFVDLNGYEDLQFNVSRPITRDIRVRQAIVLAVSKQELIDTSAFGQERAATADQPPWIWAHDPHLQSDAYDTAKAGQLLTQAGWLPGAGGIRRKNGQPLTLVLVSNNSNVTRRNQAVLVQAMLRKIGIDLEIKYYPGDVLFAQAAVGGILQGGRFDISRAGWIAGIDPDDSTQLTCENVAPHGTNYSRYCSARMDALQMTALDHYDRTIRKQAYFAIQALLLKDLPFDFLYYERILEPVSTAFHGFAPSPSLEDWNAQDWSI